MRLIDIDKLCTDLMERWDIADKQKEELVKQVMADIVTPIVVSQPTIEPRCETCEAFNKTRLLIPQPERKKGKWINIREGNRADCDQCGQSGRAWMNFCFDCGADMREPEDIPMEYFENGGR